jgi:hypothetical protein
MQPRSATVGEPTPAADVSGQASGAHLARGGFDAWKSLSFVTGACNAALPPDRRKLTGEVMP